MPAKGALSAERWHCKKVSGTSCQAAERIGEAGVSSAAT